MARIKVLLVCLGIVLLVWGTMAGADILHWEAQAFSHEELILDRAPLIIRGEVMAVRDLTDPAFDSEDRFFYQEAVVSVLERIKGECPDEIRLVIFAQGRYEIDPPVPYFRAGQEMLLFLHPERGMENYYWYWLYYDLGMGGPYAGAYVIEDEKLFGSDVRAEEFVAQIRELLAGERSEITLELPAVTARPRMVMAKISDNGSEIVAHFDGQFVAERRYVWKEENLPCALYYDPTGAPASTDHDTVMTLIGNALSTWESVTTSFMNFSGPSLTNYHDRSNGRSEVWWENLRGLGGHEFTTWDESKQWAVETDIRLDTSVKWHISSGTNVPSDAYDLQSVLLHELGHTPRA